MSIRHNNQIWRGLVDYVNATSIEANAEALEGLAKTLWHSMHWMARTAFASTVDDVPEMIAQQVRPGLGLNGSDNPPWVSFKGEKQLMDQFQKQAVKYQAQVRLMLCWLADPKKNASLREEAFAFLREHTDHIEFHRGDPAFAPEGDEEFRHFTMDGQVKDDFPRRTLLYKDIADVICDFVQREHEARRPVPIQMCKRPECGNLVAILKKRQFCKTAACDKERQRRENDDQKRKNRDALVLWRLRHKKAGTRRSEIRKRVERLLAIESYWHDKNNSLSAHARNLLRQIQASTEGTTVE